MQSNIGMSSYNIDALRLANGTFKLADRRLVKGALETEHVTHLQREDRTVAMRRSLHPDREVLYTIDFPNSRTDYQTENLREAIDIVMSYLNQGEHKYEANDGVQVHCNQAWREGTVLAVLGEEILVEGEMPGTTSQWGRGRYAHPAQPTSFLRVINVGLGDFRKERSVSYNVVPKKWINEMRAQDMDWIGMGQRMIKPLPFPSASK